MNQNISGRNPRQLAVFCEMKLKEGYKKEAVFNAMINEGCPPSDASLILKESLRVLRGRAIKLAVAGAIFFLAGTGATLSSYRTAYESGGGVYVLCFGAVICGIICLIHTASIAVHQANPTDQWHHETLIRRRSICRTYRETSNPM